MITEKKNKKKASYPDKDRIIQILAKEKMTCVQIKQATGFCTKQMTNYMQSLKKFGFIRYCSEDSHLIARQRRLELVMNRSYGEVMDEIIEEKSQSYKPFKSSLEFSKHASMKVSCDKYHTTGNKSKVSAWNGYSSFSGAI